MEFALGVTSSLVASAIVFTVARYRRWILIGDARRTWQFARRLERAGITNFFTARDEYPLYRKTSTLLGYLTQARSRIDIAGYWLAQGNEMESISNGIVGLIQARPGLVVRISLVDPSSPFVPGLAKYLGLDEDETRARIRASLVNLTKAREMASDTERQRITISTYQELPIASAIMLDYGTEDGVIQLDFKPPRAPRSRSFTLELTGPSKFYETCSTAWIAVVDGSEPFIRTQPDGR